MSKYVIRNLFSKPNASFTESNVADDGKRTNALKNNDGEVWNHHHRNVP